MNKLFFIAFKIIEDYGDSNMTKYALFIIENNY